MLASAPAAIAGASEVVKMKPGGIRADRVAAVAGGGDVAAHDAEALGERAVDDVDAVHDAVALGDAAAARAIEADGMDLIEIGQGAILLGEIADRADRGDVPVHRVDALEGDDLRRGAIELLQLRFEIGEVVVPEDVLRPAAIADAGDHRGVVLLVGEDDAAGQELGERRQCGFVGDEGRREQQRRFLAVQVGELALELDVVMRRAGDVARAAGAGADRIDRLVHGGEHRRVLAHAEIVVGAPDGDGTRGLGLLKCSAEGYAPRRRFTSANTR